MNMKKHTQDINGEPITYWRSVDNRKRTQDYINFIENEFEESSEGITHVDRRSMLKFMGASAALAGIGMSCRRPVEKILPYVKAPENITPGIPKFYATAQPTPYGANPILVESHEGRPTKIEGNPSHSESMGKASFIAQAAALEIYDPDRSRFCVQKKAGAQVPVSWSDFDVFLAQHMHELKNNQGEGFALVSNNNLSPTFLSIKQQIKNKFPKTKFYTHEPMRQKNIEEGTKLAYGSHTRVKYNFGQAKIIASIFADCFSFGPDHIRNSQGFAKNRSIYEPKDAPKMNRLYSIEAEYSLSGTNADHRLKLAFGLAHKFIMALAYELHATYDLDISSGTLSSLVTRPPSYQGLDKKFIFVLAKDLAKNRGQALIFPGENLDPATIGLIHILNNALGGLNKTYNILKINNKLAQESLDDPDILDLAQDIKNKKIDSLVFLGVNPVYDAPGSIKFGSLLKNISTTIHLGIYKDETAKLCDWHVPVSHFLENFSDTRSYNGTVSIIQPLIRPIHKTRSMLEILAQISEGKISKSQELVKKNFAQEFTTQNYNKSVHDGLVKNSGFLVLRVPKLFSREIFLRAKKIKIQKLSLDNLELIVNFDRRMLDGRYANHGWLQELPDPVTKLNWGNSLLISPKLARELKIKSGLVKNKYIADIVELEIDSKKISYPVFVMPGISDYSLLVNLGYGRTQAGEVGNHVGQDAYKLLQNFNEKIFWGVKLTKTQKTQELSSTQEQFAINGEVVQDIDILTMHGRDFSRDTELADYVKTPLKAKHQGIPQNLLVKDKNQNKLVPLQMTKPWDYSSGNQWGMVIDLAKCTGCNACITACQSENNIPVVGPEQVMRGRMMHWIRVDRYFVGDVHNPKALTQPIPCMHCENAPCEPVCPVAATVHDSEGLNGMAYNRCIGTRYCANNCPYKVRRFNYFDFSHSGNMYVDPKQKERQKTIKLQRNPDVTVRYRGVMEKCTYCTQRIQEQKMIARRENRDQNNLPDGSVTPACAQTCPSEAIIFGNINDPKSRVSKLKKVDRNYTLLDILNSRPRTSYLSKLRNPHPLLVT